MPGLDGFETAKLIRDRQQSRHTPIIFLTAFDLNRLSVQEAYALGAVDYLVKAAGRRHPAGQGGGIRRVVPRQVPRGGAASGRGEGPAAGGALAQQAEALRQADRRKDEFLATLAHELKNHVAPVRNAVQVLLLKGRPTPTPLVPGHHRRQAGHLVRLVEDLLDLSRVKQGASGSARSRWSWPWWSPTRWRPAGRSSTPAPHPGGVAAALAAAGGRPDAAVPGPDQPAPQRGEVHAGGGHVRLSGRRTGARSCWRAGRRHRHRPGGAARVFDLFMQDEAGRPHSQGGLGIGLSLVKSIVELHGGTVLASSAGPGRAASSSSACPPPVNRLALLIPCGNGTAFAFQLMLNVRGRWRA